MRKTGVAVALLVSASMFFCLGASRAFCDDNMAEKLDRALKELDEVKQRLARLEGGEPSVRFDEAMTEKIEKWFESKDKEIMERLSSSEFRRSLLGIDLELEGGLTFIYQAIVGGVHSVHDDRDGARRDALSLRFDLGLRANLTENQYVYMLLRAGNGDGIDAAVPNNIGLNDAAFPSADPLDPTNAGSASDVRMIEAYYEGSFFKGKVVLTFGKIDLTNYFDANVVANDETTQFISTALINNLTIPFADDNDAGIRLLYSPFGAYDPDDEDPGATDWLILQVALSETDANFNEVTQDGLGIFEVEFRPHKAPCLKHIFGDRPGHYRFGFYFSEADFATLGEQRRGATNTPDHGTVGFYLSFDQNVCDWLTLFMRYGSQDSDVALNDQFWSFGGAIAGSLWGREDDVLAFGLGINVNNSDSGFLWPQYQGDERIWEMYYRWQVNEHIAFSPVLQVLQNLAGERSGTTTATILGLRLQIDF